MKWHLIKGIFDGTFISLTSTESISAATKIDSNMIANWLEDPKSRILASVHYGESNVVS